MEILEVNNVSKTFPTFKLDDFSFTVKSGQILGFIGSNGAGKSTTLKGIMELLHFDSGEILYCGENIKNCTIKAKQEIGFSLSELNFYPNKTIKQINNVTSRFYKNYSAEKFRKLCQLFNLDENKKLEKLSSGMKVKFTLAMALSHDAKLLILDEPTSGLDPFSRDEILDIFKKIVKDGERAIIFSTHITSDLEKCADEILYIKEGKKVFQEKRETLENAYLIVSGENYKFSHSMKDKMVSFKEENGEISGLISTSFKSSFEGFDLKFKEANLEEIMINYERGKNHEEFVL